MGIDRAWVWVECLSNLHSQQPV